MPKSHNPNRVRFEKPGTYEIVVQGILQQSWSDRLSGMQITTENPDGEAPITTLIGHLRDQTQLNGVLNSIYDMHLPILSVANVKVSNGVDG